MRSNFLAIFTAIVLASACLRPVHAQDTLNFPHLGEVLRFDDAMDDIIDSESQIEVIASGFDWTEGPVWVAGEPGFLLFSDIPANSIFRWDEGEGISLFMNPSGYTGVTDYGNEPGSNGLMLNADGELFACEHGDRRISMLTIEGGKRTVVDNYQGKRLNSPNDLIFHSNGTLYFTDPPYGLPQRYDDLRRELDFCGVYRVGKLGQLELMTSEMSRPNGIAFSPDEKTLYVAQSDPDAAIWKAFPVKADGTLGKSRLMHDATSDVGKLPGLPDGMAVTTNGIIFATGPGGVYVFNKEEKLIGRLSTGERTSNCTFGGPNRDILYITADMYVCRIQTKLKGL